MRTVRTSIPYAVRLSAAGTLQWVERRGDEEIVHDREPGTGSESPCCRGCPSTGYFDRLHAIAEDRHGE